MNIRTLKIFQMVCEEKTITEAAKKLYMTQPAISHAIHNLEEELNLLLFERRGKRIYLNEHGKTFLKYTQRVLSSFEDLQHSVSNLQKESNIRIGSSITIANDMLPTILAQFKEIYPITPVEVYVDRASNILECLQNRSIDIALVEGIVCNTEWLQQYISSYPLRIVCSKKHTLANRKCITWDEVTQQVWLLREIGSAVRESFESACRLHHIVIKPTWTSVNSQALLQAVRANLGVSILPNSVIEACSFRNELNILDITGTPLINKNHIVYSKDLFMSEVVKDFIYITKAYGDTINMAQ